MAFKFVVFAAVLAVVRAGVLDYSHGYAAAPAVTSHSQHSAAPVSYGHAYAAGPEAHYSHAAPAVQYAAPAHYAAPVAKAPAQYDFEYSVQDPHTGDVKSQKEVRHGDAVQGSYSLIEADGSKRIVEYTADAHNGFNAVVHHEPAAHQVPVKAVAAPVAVKYAAPASVYRHAAPAAYRHSAPAAYSHTAPASYSHTAPASYSHSAPGATYSSYSEPNHYYHH